MICLALALCLTVSACAEEIVGWSNPLVPPPYPPEHEPAGDDYFEDAVFLGDSIMENIEMLDLFPTANFVTLVGMSPISMDKKLFLLQKEDRWVTAYDMINLYSHKKIFIFLGSNALDHKTYEGTLGDYRVMMERMIHEYPDTVFYLLCPTSPNRARVKKDGLDIRRYWRFREGLMALAEEMQVYFLDAFILVADEDGYLSEEYAAPDGFHLKVEGSKLIEQLVRTHTVDVE
ncbi:MAG: hypothetical protein IKH30_03380 [Clostridia bacterium]|nr:hypothetical protein [Clostridia bacterium]